MQAVVLDAFVKDLGELTVKTVPIPSPKPGHVVVKIVAASINPVDKLLVLGAMHWPVTFPYVPCEDYAGVVHAIGEDVQNVKVGDEVFLSNWGVSKHNDDIPDALIGGAFAEYALIPVHKLSIKPKEVTFEEAAAIGIAGTTAHECLFALGEVKAGTKVLILGGSSAVGIFAIQFAHLKGAIVYTTASNRTADFVNTQLLAGKGRLINYDQEKWYEVLNVEEIDVIFDTVGEKDGLTHAIGTAADSKQRILKQQGKFISIAEFTIGFNPFAYVEQGVSFGAAICFKQNANTQSEIASWIANKQVKVYIDTVFDMEKDGVKAVQGIFEKIATGKSVGKNILKISSSASSV